MEVLVLVLLLAFVSGDNKDLRRIDSIKLEPECLSQGGMCVVAADCPSGSLAEERGLCPKQKKKGIECCYGISVKETRCGKRGGECFNQTVTFCNDKLVSKEATDCPSGTQCCILV